MGLTELTLEWPKYRLFPYERELAIRETKAILKPQGEVLMNGSVQLRTRHPEFASSLTYFLFFQVGKPVLDMKENTARQCIHE